jgi:nitrite reductase (NADH) small subunit
MTNNAGPALLDVEDVTEQVYVAVAELDEMEDDIGTLVEVDGVKIALFKFEDDTVSAIANTCPHQGAPLSEGWFDQEDGCVTCPLHAWDFDVRTGQRTNGPESVQSYKTRVVEGVVEVAL